MCSVLLSGTYMEHRLTEFHSLAVAEQYFFDSTRCAGLDFVHYFHGFDDADHRILTDNITDLNKRLVLRVCSLVERTNHGRDDIFKYSLSRRFCLCQRVLRPGWLPRARDCLQIHRLDLPQGYCRKGVSGAAF